MPKVTVRGTGQKVDCNKSIFVAQGGEGAVYIQNGIVYKVCNDPSNMIPEGKFQELAALSHPRIIVPQDVLLDKRNDPIGYTMKAVPGDPMPLAKILTKSYREREGVTPDMMFELVKQIIDGIQYIHSQGKTVGDYLQVDGNELNYMVTSDYREAYFIDTNSYQTPSYPADAIMLSIRDWSVKKGANGWEWSTLSDAYSFAVISFYMFTAIHPFKGRHPHCTDPKTMMTENMKHHKSVLDPETKFPTGAVYHPFEDVIPGGANGEWMQWYKALFVEGKRLPIPGTVSATIVFAPKVKEIKGSGHFNIEEVKEYAAMLIQYADKGGRSIAVTKEQVYVDGGIKPKPPGDKLRVGFTPQKNVPVAAWLDSGKVMMQNLDTQLPIRCDLSGKNLMACEGRLYVQGQQDVSEVTFIEAGSNPIAAASAVASIMPNATDMYQGVVVQDMLGATMVSVFPKAGHHRQFKMAELNGYRVTEAKYEGNVLMIVGIHKADGHYNRFVFRFANDWQSYDCRVVENITPTGLNFTVADTGICVCINEEDHVEIIRNRKDDTKVTVIDDPDIKGDMRLCHSGAQIRLAYGNKIYNFSMKK